MVLNEKNIKVGSLRMNGSLMLQYLPPVRIFESLKYYRLFVDDCLNGCIYTF